MNTRAQSRWGVVAFQVLIATLAVLAGSVALSTHIAVQPRLAAAATVFCGVFVAALPFLGLGVVASAMVATFVTPDRLARWLPKRKSATILVAAVGGAALPGCECGSVPVARRLFDGFAGAAALTFMLSAPAINPVVMIATAVAFPEQPVMVAARFVASLLTAMIMGALWARWGNPGWVTRRLPTSHDDGASRWTVFTDAARHDFLAAATYLIIGAAAAAALRVFLPASWFEGLAGNLVVAVVTMALLAVVLSLCSEADAFVAASMTALPLVPRLVFLVVGPAVDLKLFAMQAGMFGRRFAIRFAPTTLVVATAMATVVGLLLLDGAP